MTNLIEQINKEHKAFQACTEFECPRCNGKGWLPEFRHIKGGECFMCNGNKTVKINSKINMGKGRKPKVVYTKANDTYKVYESLEVIFDGKFGYVPEVCWAIVDSNREELRALWKAFKANGAIMQIATVDVIHTEENYRLGLRNIAYNVQTV